MKGFTLIEVLLYSALMLIIVGSILIFVFTVVASNDDLYAVAELAENAAFLQQKVTWVLTGASEVTAPAVGAVGATLIATKAGVAYTVDLSEGTVRLASGLADPVALTNNFVTVTSLSFEQHSFSADIPSAVRMRAKIENFVQPVPASITLDWYVTPY